MSREIIRAALVAYKELADHMLCGEVYKSYSKDAERATEALRLFDEQPAHPDDAAVDLFAADMKSKLAVSRAKGRGGWEYPTAISGGDLAALLVEHVAKGDPVDVANLAMMLHLRRIAHHSLSNALNDYVCAKMSEQAVPVDVSGLTNTYGMVPIEEVHALLAGKAIVPVKATPEMIKAALPSAMRDSDEDKYRAIGEIVCIWDAMLAASTTAAQKENSNE